MKKFICFLLFECLLVTFAIGGASTVSAIDIESSSISVLPSSVTVSPSTLSIEDGDRCEISATVLPATATNKNVRWYSMDTTVALVTVENGTAYVIGVHPGVTQVGCITVDGYVESSNECTVTVTPTSYTSLTLGTVYNGSNVKSKHFWFQFTPTTTGTYVFESSGTRTSALGVFLYRNNTLLASDNDSGIDDNFKLTYRLMIGTTYRFMVYANNYLSADNFSVSLERGWPIVNSPSILSRDSWNARPKVTSRLEERVREPARIIFHHSADKFSSTNVDDVIEEIQSIQNLHIDERLKCDIAYHFIIDPAGRIWEGAEIDSFKRGHAENYFDDIGIVILGDFESRLANLFNPNQLNQQQMLAAIAISKWLCYEYDLSIIESGLNIAPISSHRIVNDTECPGGEAGPWIENNLRVNISSWRS